MVADGTPVPLATECRVRALRLRPETASEPALPPQPALFATGTAMASSSTTTPTTRSRTLLFLSYRDSRASSSRFRRSRVSPDYDDTAGEDEQDRLIHPDAAHVSIDADLPPRWYFPAPCHVFQHINMCVGLT